jgi:hypothetical protein
MHLTLLDLVTPSFEWLSEQMTIISLNRINWLVCITKMESVYRMVNIGSLNTGCSRENLLSWEEHSWDPRSIRNSRSVEWQFLIEVLGQPINPIFKHQALLDPWRWDQYVVVKRP